MEKSSSGLILLPCSWSRFKDGHHNMQVFITHSFKTRENTYFKASRQLHNCHNSISCFWKLWTILNFILNDLNKFPIFIAQKAFKMWCCRIDEGKYYISCKAELFVNNLMLFPKWAGPWDCLYYFKKSSPSSQTNIGRAPDTFWGHCLDCCFSDVS